MNAILILEILGRPPEHLVETLEDLIKKINEEKGVSVKNKKINEPTELKENLGFFASFAEIEVDVESTMHLAMLMFKYMPAHIEIISPEKIDLTKNDLGEVLNELTRRLHGYDEVARVIQAEKMILETKLKSILEEKNNNEKA